MNSRKQQFDDFLAAVAETGRFTKAEIEPPEHGGNIATISGEVGCQQDHEEIVEMARQHGFHLFAQELFVPYEREE